MGTQLTIWDKIDQSMLVRATSPETTDRPTKSDEQRAHDRRRRKRARRVCDVIASIAWLFLMVKVFIYGMSTDTRLKQWHLALLAFWSIALCFMSVSSFSCSQFSGQGTLQSFLLTCSRSLW